MPVSGAHCFPFPISEAVESFSGVDVSELTQAGVKLLVTFFGIYRNYIHLTGAEFQTQRRSITVQPSMCHLRVCSSVLNHGRKINP